MSGTFWGTLLILWGVSMIVETVFHVNIPFARIAFAFIVIAWGVQILTGWRWPGVSSSNRAVFSSADFGGKELQPEYAIVFGSGDVDLTGIVLDRNGGRTAVRSVFSSTVVRVDPKKPVRVRVSAAFGEASLPGGREVHLGEATWESASAKGSDRVLEIKAETVFGRLEVIAR
ncbi:MAG: LiaF domain-containing protein [bacterium]